MTKKNVRNNSVNNLHEICGIFIFFHSIFSAFPVDFLYRIITALVIFELFHEPYQRIIIKLTGKTGRKELNLFTYVLIALFVGYLSSFIIQTIFMQPTT